MHSRMVIIALSTILVGALSASSPPATQPAADNLRPTQPPITIDIKDTTLRDVAAALSKATNTHVIAYRSTEAKKFTLNSRIGPFWEIFDELDRQFPLTFAFARPDDAAELAVMHAARRPPRAIAGDFMVYGSVAVRTRPDSPLILHWGIVSDPRMRISAVRVPSLQAEDDHGNKYTAKANTDSNSSDSNRHWTLQTVLPEPTAPAGTTLSVKATLNVGIGEGFELTDPVTIHVQFKDVPMRPNPR
jgi:hypothetical protein